MSYLLSSGLNKVDKLQAAAGATSGIRPNVGETGIFIYDKNVRIYTSANGGTTWAAHSTASIGASYAGLLISWTGIDRIYLRTADSVGDMAAETRVYPRSENISTPAPAGVAYTTIENLSDVPDYDGDEAGQYLKVNSGGTALEFATVSGGSTYSATDEFVLSFSQLSGTSGSLSLGGSNVGSGSTFSYVRDDSGATVNSAAISIPGGSRIAGIQWSIVEDFAVSSGTMTGSAFLEFGDGALFSPSGEYHITYPQKQQSYSGVAIGSHYEIKVALASTIVSGVKFKIVSPGDFDFTTMGATANTAGIEFTATGNAWSLGTGQVVVDFMEYGAASNDVGTEFVATAAISSMPGSVVVYLATTTVTSGQQYQIAANAGSQNFTSIGSASNNVGTMFKATSGVTLSGGDFAWPVSESYGPVNHSSALALTMYPGRIGIAKAFGASPMYVPYQANPSLAFIPTLKWYGLTTSTLSAGKIGIKFIYV